jgi:hypothetical protein
VAECPNLLEQSLSSRELRLQVPGKSMSPKHTVPFWKFSAAATVMVGRQRVGERAVRVGPRDLPPPEAGALY